MRRLYILLVLLLAIACPVSSKRKDGKKKEHQMKNICMNDDNPKQATMVCNCNILEPDSANEAICWVFGGTIQPEDPAWETFQSQTMLTKIKFNVRANGKLPDIPTTALKYTKRLENLEILYASIPELSPFVFSNLSSLMELSLSRNQISVLHPYSFSYMMNLTTVNLDENRISELPRNVFVQVPRLKMLYIDKCNLSIIHDNAFEHLNALDELELSENQLSIVTRETFVGLRMLKRLDLRSNRLNMIGDFTFAELINLYELDLDQNNLEFISEDAFSGLSKLSKLRLSENKLKSLDEDVFRGSTSIQFLDLRSNDLEILTFDTLEPIWDNFRNHSSYIYLESKYTLTCRTIPVSVKQLVKPFLVEHFMNHSSYTYLPRNTIPVSVKQLVKPFLVEHFMNHSSYLHLGKNQMKCDCHLSWVYSLRNETNSDAIKNALEELTCVSEEVVLNTATEPPPTILREDQDQSDAAGDYEYSVEYDDDQPIEVLDGRKHVFQIPIDKLPCPEMQRATTVRSGAVDGPLGPFSPSQGGPNGAKRLASSWLWAMPVVFWMRTALVT